MEYYGKSLAITQEAKGEKHPAVADIYYDMAKVSLSEDDHANALKFYGMSLAIRKDVLGELSSAVDNTYSSMAK